MILNLSSKTNSWALLGGLLLFGWVVGLIRRRKLKECYALLWFLTAVLFLSLTLNQSWLDDLAGAMGVVNSSSALILVVLSSMAFLFIHFSTVISGLLNDRQVLTQQLGILESRVRELEKESLELSLGTIRDEGISNNSDATQGLPCK